MAQTFSTECLAVDVPPRVPYPSTMDAVDDVLGFWFGTPDPVGDLPDEVFARYWKRDDAFDAEIRERFSALHTSAAASELDSWCATARGRVALVILLDQFSRNLSRKSPGAFANDERALAVALEGIEQGELAQLCPMQRYFLIMPTMHAEDLAAQEHGIRLFDELVKSTEDPGLGRRFAGAADFARRHRDIVARFGRFPHRNASLGRASTPEETEFLSQPGSSF
jgi:uncharacterized protein (DUF924 family)